MPEKLFGTKPAAEEAPAPDPAAAEREASHHCNAELCDRFRPTFKTLIWTLMIKSPSTARQLPSRIKKKAGFTLGNVEGIASVDDRLSVLAPAEPEAEMYEVKSEIHCQTIKEAFYGDPMV